MSIIEAMSEIGLVVPDLILDGNIHRVSTADRPNKRNGWYVGNEGYCTYGRWDTGEKCSIWKADQHKFNNITHIINTAEIERKKKQFNARKVAERLWVMSSTCLNHAYLLKKQIKPYVSKILGSELFIPIYNSDTVLVNLQRIDEDGNKKFLFGGEIAGCGTALGNLDKDTICICEGFATGASIAEATGYPVVVAFNAGNLFEVSKNIKSKYPNSKIILCADNDDQKIKNIGVIKAQEAAKEVDGIVKIPTESGDFNDLAVRRGLNVVRDIICAIDGIITGEDLRGKYIDFSTEIPDLAITDCGALLSTGISGCLKTDAPEILQYMYPILVSVIAKAISGRIEFKTVWPNLYNVKVGSTSTGKTHIDKIIRRLLLEIEGFFGMSDFASGPGLLRGMSEPGNNNILLLLDEVSYLFRRFDRHDPVSTGKISALLELYSSAGCEIRKPYGDKTKSIVIRNPCLNLLGNATQLIFDDLRAEDLLNGLIQRVDFWCYDGQLPYRKTDISELDRNKDLKSFIDGIKKIESFSTAEYYSFIRGKNAGSDKDLRCVIGAVVPLSIRTDAKELLDLYSREITDEINSNESDGIKGIISRKYDLAIKYAMIRFGSRTLLDYKECEFVLDVADLMYGFCVADMLADFKVKKIVSRISEGQFHRDCEIFKAAIRAACILNLRPTGRVLAGRRGRIKALKPSEFNDIVRALESRKEIIIDNSRNSTAYFLSDDTQK